MAQKNTNYDKYIKLAMILFSIMIIGAVLFIKPYLAGDGQEYALLIEAFQNHGTPNVTLEDIKSGQINYEVNFDKASIDGMYPPGFHEGLDGKIYTAHFWLYSLMVLPLKLILQFIGANQLRAFQLFNALLYVFTIYFVYKQMKIKKRDLSLLLGLIMINPAVFYITWTHTEIFMFCLVIISLVLFYNNRYKSAIFIISVSAMQNPMIIFLGGFYFLDYLIKNYLAHKKSHENIMSAKNLVMVIRTWCMFIPFFIPIILSYINFGVPSIIATVAGSKDHLIEKMFNYLFDLNLGIFPFMPFLVIIFIVIIILGIIKRKYYVLIYAGSFFMVLFFLGFQLQINCGMAGIMRYNVWLIPILIFIIITQKNELFSGKILRFIDKTIVISIILTGITVAYFGTFKVNYGALEFNSLAKLILDQAPQLYNPIDGIFISRTQHLEGYYISEPVIYTNEDGYVRKVLLNNDLRDEFLSRINSSPEESVQLNKEINKNLNSKGNFYYNFTGDEIRIHNQKIDEQNISIKIEAIDLNEILNADTMYKVKVNIENRGQEAIFASTYQPNLPIHISYHWLDENENIVEFEGIRSTISETINPGENIETIMSIQTPKNKGHFKLMLDMVQENVMWFSDLNTDRFIYDIEIQ